jgi:hypothetical protein
VIVVLLVPNPTNAGIVLEAQYPKTMSMISATARSVHRKIGRRESPAGVVDGEVISEIR